MPSRTIFDRPLRGDPILLVWGAVVMLTGWLALDRHTTWSGSFERTRVLGFVTDLCSGVMTSFLLMALLPACLRWLWRHGWPTRRRYVARHGVAAAAGPPGPPRPGTADVCGRCPLQEPAEQGQRRLRPPPGHAAGLSLLDHGRTLRAGAVQLEVPSWLRGDPAEAAAEDEPERPGLEEDAEAPAVGEAEPSGALGVGQPDVVVPLPRIVLPHMPDVDPSAPTVRLPRMGVNLPEGRFTVRRRQSAAGEGGDPS